MTFYILLWSCSVACTPLPRMGPFTAEMCQATAVGLRERRPDMVQPAFRVRSVCVEG